MAGGTNERSPLLQPDERHHEDRKVYKRYHFDRRAWLNIFWQLVQLDDEDHPRNWGKWRKLRNIAVIASMAGTFRRPYSRYHIC
jgi:hypothetical protein